MRCLKYGLGFVVLSLFSASTFCAGGFEEFLTPENRAWIRELQKEAQEQLRKNREAQDKIAKAKAEEKKREMERAEDILKHPENHSEQMVAQAERKFNRAADSKDRIEDAAFRDQQRWRDLEHQVVGKLWTGGLDAAFGAINESRDRKKFLGKADIDARAKSQADIEKTKQYLAFLEKDPVKKVLFLGGVSVALSAGYYGSRDGIEFITESYKKPALADDDKTSLKFGLLNTLKSWIFGDPQVESSLADVILKPELAERINESVVALKNSVKNGAYLKNIMLWGQPGTGKTMLAMRMARSCGLDYIYFTASNLEPFSTEEASNQLIQLFRYAQSSERKIMIIIDEAEALLGSRGNANVTDKKKTLLNLVLGYTGTETRDYMVTILTNRPGDIDEAFLSRCDERIQIAAPAPTERRKILQLYVDKLLKKASNLQLTKPSIFSRRYWFGQAEEIHPPTIEEGALSDEALDDISRRIKDFVGRDISKMVIQMQSSALATKDNRITKDLINRVVNNKIVELKEQSKGFERDMHSAAAAA